jgi:hypothetical protein
VAKGYGCEATDWELKSELDLLLLMLCEDNKAIMVVRVKENCQHTPKQNRKKQRKIKLQHVTWECPRKNCAKKVHQKIKKKHHIAVLSRA